MAGRKDDAERIKGLQTYALKTAIHFDPADHSYNCTVCGAKHMIADDEPSNEARDLIQHAQSLPLMGRADMSDLFPITLTDEIECVRREIKMRRRVYPRWIETKRMTKLQADREIETMEAVLARLIALHQAENRPARVARDGF